ncbi:hypothetical protein EDB84DRAFT_1560794 [Lactarius hengduanensis]|nr:hypothetical protein EDB84DRAFT_1560794 [Lactarius hengduanensis]
MTEEGPTDFYIDTKLSPVSDSSTSTDDIAVEHPSTGILGEDIGGDDDDKIVVYTQKRLLPPTLSLSLCLSIRKRTILRTPALPPVSELKLWPAVPKGDIVPAPSPVPVPVQAFKKISFSLLSSSPKPRHRASWPRRTAVRKAEQRRGDSDVDWGGSTSEWVVEVEVSDDGYARGPGDWGRCDDCLPPSSYSAKEPLEASSSPSAAGVPHTPSANSNSAPITLPLLLLALSPSSSSSSASSRRILASSSKSPALAELDEGRSLDLDSDIGDEDRIIGRIQDFLDENDDIIRAKDREQRSASSGPSTTASSRSTSMTYRQFTETLHTPSLTAVPPARPRTFSKKAERASVCASELERITGAVAIVDPFTPKKRCSKTAHKATRQAAASFSLETVIGHIQHFVQDLGSAPTLSLTTARNTRNSVLSGAHAFSMKSQSEGKDSARFTRLIETTLSDAFAWILVKSPPPHGSGGAG